MLLRISNATFGYAGQPIVHLPSLSLDRGQSLGVFGANGSGKTTLMRGMLGLLAPMTGTVEQGISPRIGYLPQHRGLDFDWPMSALDAAAMATSARRPFGWIGGFRANVIEALRALDLEDLAHRPFAKLSGGQQQRVLLAGALADRPDLLALDEPTDGLDIRSRRALLSSIRNATTNGLGMLIVSHEVEDLMAVADRIVWLHPPQQAGEPSTVELISPAALAERVVGTRSTI